LTLSLDDTSLFGSTAKGEILRVPKRGGTATVLFTAQPKVEQLLADGDSLYWLTSTSLMKGAKGGGKPQVCVANVKTPGGLAADEQGLVWTERGQGLVRRATRSCSVAPPLANKQWDALSIASGGGRVFWSVGAELFSLEGRVAKSAYLIDALALSPMGPVWLDESGTVQLLSTQAK
jgi:hypothetical protein